jgi:hypothetical protein
MDVEIVPPSRELHPKESRWLRDFRTSALAELRAHENKVKPNVPIVIAQVIEEQKDEEMIAA